MQKIAYICPSFYPAIKYGGPIYSTLQTCENLSKLDIEVYVSTTNTNVDSKLWIKPNIFIKQNTNFYIKYYNETIIGILSIKLLFNVWKDIKKADLVHIQAIFNSPVPIALFYGSFFKKPIILTPRGALAEWGILNKKSSSKKFWINFLIRPFSKNVIWHATSYSEEKDILRFFPKAKVVLIPNGVNIIKSEVIDIDNLFYRKYLETQVTYFPILVTMGRIHAVKGFDILIKCLIQIKKQYPNVILFIAGEDNGELNYLKKLSSELILNNHVFFTGNLEGKEKLDFFSNASVFALPSHTENFGMVYAEALAAGTPIVASTNTPWEEVEDAGCGRWVPNTIESTTEAILDLLSRDREELRQNALKYVQKFDWKNIALQFKELYENVLNEHESRKKK